MEGKEKIVLKDGTTYPIENGASVNNVQIILQNVDGVPDVFRKFTEENLESFQIKNADGLTCTTQKNKYRVDAVIIERELDVLLTVRLADVDMTQKQLAELTSRTDALESSQKSQNGAIRYIDEKLAEMEVGGEE